MGQSDYKFTPYALKKQKNDGAGYMKNCMQLARSIAKIAACKDTRRLGLPPVAPQFSPLHKMPHKNRKN